MIYMFKKLSQYSIEIIIGVAIFVAIIYFLPSNNIDIPTIDDLALSGVDLNFVLDDEHGDTIDTWVVVGDTGDVELAIVSGAMQTGSVSDFIDNTITLPTIKDSETQQPILEPTQSYNNCTAPWGANVAHGNSVIAYQQRSDDPSTCNIQRRTCNDGVLNGSYTQSSCKEYFGYDNKTEQVVSYNIPKTNPLVQPKPTSTIQNNTSPINNGGPSSRWFGGSTSNTTIALVSDYSYVRPDTPANGVIAFSNIGWWSSNSSSTTRDGTTCMTPRWTQVRNGQFVKAYKVNNGFTNLPCEVELRYCVQQELQGSFPFQSCVHNDIAVEDFLDNYFDPNRPSLMQLVETLYNYARTPIFQSEYNSIIDLERLMSLLDDLR